MNERYDGNAVLNKSGSSNRYHRHIIRCAHNANREFTSHPARRDAIFSRCHLKNNILFYHAQVACLCLTHGFILGTLHNTWEYFEIWIIHSIISFSNSIHAINGAVRCTKLRFAENSRWLSAILDACIGIQWMGNSLNGKTIPLCSFHPCISWPSSFSSRLLYFCLPSPPRKQNECLTEKKQQEITRVLQIFKLALVCLQRTTHTRHRSIQQQQHLTAYGRSEATMQKINYVKI